MPPKGGKRTRSAACGSGKAAKHVTFSSAEAFNSSLNSEAYLVPGDEVADEDLEFDFVDWATCERSRGLDVRLSVRTRILLACHATDHLDKVVLMESWERSGLMPFNPERVLSTLTDDEVDESTRRKSGRLKSKEAAKLICKLALQYNAGEIDEQQLIIGVKETADDAVCYHITESTGAAAAKGVKRGAIASDWGSKKRQISKTDQFRSGSFQGSQYDAVGEKLDEQADALNRSQPWECRVVESRSKKECGHRLKSNAGLTKHAEAKHNGVGNYFNHSTGETKTFVTGDAAAAAAAAAGAAAPPVAAAAAAAAAAAVAAPPAPALADNGARRVKCQICGGFYTAATIGKHNKKRKHKVAAASAAAAASI
jgi:hypothetical protein